MPLEEEKKGVKLSKLDIGIDVDLMIDVANLIKLEEHYANSYEQTGDEIFLKLWHETRMDRGKLMTILLKSFGVDLEKIEKKGDTWCLPPDSIIFKNPSPSPISSIRPGEKVLTREGKFMRVSRTYVRKYRGEMIKIYPYYSYPVMLTPEHEVLVVSNLRRKQRDVWRKNFGKVVFEWKNAKELSDQDFLVFPIYKNVVDREKFRVVHYDRSHKKLMSKEIKVDKHLMELIGLYLSEGSITERRYFSKREKRWKKSYSTYFSFGKHEKALIDKTKKLIEKVFGYKAHITKTHTNIDVVSGRVLVKKFFEQFGRRSTEKRIPKWIIDLPRDKLLYLIKGIVEGDGYISKYSINISTSSELLAHQLRLILFKCGIIHSIDKTKAKLSKIGERVIKPTKEYYYIIRISGDYARQFSKEVGIDYYGGKRTSGSFGYVTENFVLIPIRKIERVMYDGYVYNLEVPGSETYTTVFGVVHNCTNKHHLSTWYGLREVASKYIALGDLETAKALEEIARKEIARFMIDIEYMKGTLDQKKD